MLFFYIVIEWPENVKENFYHSAYRGEEPEVPAGEIFERYNSAA